MGNTKEPKNNIFTFIFLNALIDTGKKEHLEPDFKMLGGD
jgi:hypothetical protein